MAFDETLAARIRDALARKKVIDEKKMFGGICFRSLSPSQISWPLLDHRGAL